VPATTNPLGVKGVGEAGTTASIAAVMNAVADALPGGAGAHLDMPVTAMKLWEACRQASHSFIAVTGMSRCAPAPPGNASATAFITAAIEAVVPASPTPLTPSGLVVAGT